MNTINMDSRLLLIIKSLGVTTKSTLLKEFDMSEDFKLHFNIENALYKLVIKNKITMIRKDKVDYIYYNELNFQ